MIIVPRARGKSAFVGVGEETADRLADAGLDVTFRAHPVGHRIASAEFDDVSEWLRSRL